MTLNAAQRSAVVADPAQPLIVLAGPGTGKTKTLIARIVHMLRDQGCALAASAAAAAGKVRAQPGTATSTAEFGILALTFSKAAAANMQMRLSTALTVRELSRVTVKTFHALCLQLCRENVEFLGFGGSASKSNRSDDNNNNNNNTFTLFSQKDMIGVLVRVLSKDSARTLAASAGITCVGAGGDVGRAYHSDDVGEVLNNARATLKRIDHAKRCSLGPKNFENKDPEFSGVFRRFNRAMNTERALSFIDLVSRALMLLVRVPSVLQKVRQRYPFVLCDEFQDTSTLQFSLLTALTKQHGRITVIGDDDQLIYEFSGADKRNFDRHDINYEKLPKLHHL